MESITPFISIKPKKIEYITSEYLCDNEEIIYASKIQFSFPPGRNLPAQTGYVILTYGFVYIFTKEEGRLILQEQICVFDCQEIKFIEDKSKNEKTAILIKTDSESDLFTIFNGKQINTMYEFLVYSITIISNGRASNFAIPKLNPQIPLKNFPVQFRIFKRSLYLIHLDMKNQIMHSSSLEGANYFKKNNIYFRNQLLIDSSFHPGNFADYYGKAIGIEPNILVVVFQNFNEEFSTLFESILINSIKIVQIKFNEYKIAPVFSFEKVNFFKKTTVDKFQFVNSGYTIIESFMKGCSKYDLDIKNLKFNSDVIQQNDLISVFENLNKLKCFSNLTSFVVMNTKIEAFKQFPFEVFKEFLRLHTKLESLTLSDIGVDGSILFDEICKSKSNIYELHLNHLDFDEPLNLNDDQNPVKLPHNIVLIDFSHSKFKNLTMTPVLELLTKESENVSNLMVDLSYLEPRENTFIKAFKGVDLKKCHSNIIDFNWSGNNLSPDLFNFISTQKDLQYLSLLDLTVEKQNGFFQALMKCMKGSKIIGIEVGCNTFKPEFVNPFLDFLKDHQILQRFYFVCQPGQDEIGEKLADLISSLPNLKELFINAKGLSNDVCFSIGSAITKNKSVSACVFQSWEVNGKDPKIKDYIPVIKDLRNLKQPTTMEQRASSLISSKRNERIDSSAEVQSPSKQEEKTVIVVQNVEEEEDI